MRSIYILSLIASSFASPASSVTTVCTASQCLNANGEFQSAVGATFATSSSKTILLLDSYSSTSTSNAISAVSAGAASMSLAPYLTTSPSSTSSTPSLPFSVNVEPGFVTFPSPLFDGQPTITSLGATQNSTSSPTLEIGSFLLSGNSWAALSGASSQPIIFWDNTPDMSQLPSGLLSVQNGANALMGTQSTSCATPCAASGQCNSQGTCVCKPGFNGTSCETCLPGFFGPSCTACPAGCSICDDGPTGSGKCLSAQSTAAATCNCDNGTCTNGNSTCICTAGWTTLAGTTNSTGTQCSECATGFFKDSTGSCRACGANCNSCSSPSGTCSQCSSGSIPNSADLTSCSPASTATTCTDGSYPLTGGGCGTCDLDCKTCTGPTSTQCVVCADGLAMLNGTCTPVDENGVCTGSTLVADNSKGKCDACPSGCSTCQIPSFNVASTYNQVQCTACLPGQALSNGRCVSQCPAGQFVGSDGVTCTPCDSSCSACVGSALFCLTCAQSSLYALSGTCSSSCPASTFSQASAIIASSNSSASVSNTLGGSCASCHGDCQTCSGPRFDQCTSCPPSRPVKTASGRCLETCGRGQYWDTVSGQCQTCATGCASCAGAAASMCLSCAEGSVLQAGKCVPTACSGGASGVTALGGVCLSQLLGSANVLSSPASSSPVSENQSRGGTKWWKLILIVGLVVALASGVLMLWRWRARKRRALETKHFKERLDRDGIRHKSRLTVLWNRTFKNNDVDDEAAEDRRQRLRNQLRMSRSPGDAAALREMNLEEDLDRVSANEVDSWRSQVRLMSAERPSRSGHSRGFTLSGSTDLTSSLVSKLRAPTRKPVPPLGPSLSRKAPSVADTTSVYSHTTGFAPRIGGASVVSDASKMPAAKEPLKDAMFDMYSLQTGTFVTNALATQYPPPPQYQTLLEPTTMTQFQPTSALQTQPTMGSSKPSTLAAFHLAAWQTPMPTGTSTGTSAASKLGDKNPFRPMLM